MRRIPKIAMPKAFRSWLPAVALGVAGSALAATPPAMESRVFHRENVLGTSFELRVRSRDAASATNALGVALAEVDRLARIFSSYSPDSEFSRWQATRGVRTPVSPELADVLERSAHWIHATDGAFNPGAEAFTRLWREAEARGVEPDTARLAETARQVARPAWSLDRNSGVAERLGDCPLTLNAIAKGWILEQASAKAWAVGGMDGLLLEIGGDLRVRGSHPETIAVVDPRHDAENQPPICTVEVRDAGLATSGGYRRGVTVAGRHRSHILDPRTGSPSDRVLGATVIAPDAATADALSTSFSVLDPAEGIRLADATPGVACLLVLDSGEVVRSTRWPMSPTLAADPKPAPAPTTTAARPTMELSVAFDLQNTSGGRYNRPYVALWVEDADSFPVRTLLLWVLQSPKGQRWLPDLRRWHRSDDTRRLADDKDLVATASGATRNPGHYSAVWDGKDDHGKPVKPGRYTVYLEAAREHGTYQLMKHEFEVGGSGFAVDLKGNEEIGGARIEYRIARP